LCIAKGLSTKEEGTGGVARHGDDVRGFGESQEGAKLPDWHQEGGGDKKIISTRRETTGEVHLWRERNKVIRV